MAYATREDLNVLGSFMGLTKSDLDWMTGADILKDILHSAQEHFTYR